jgi:hypothetical protein
MIDLSLPHIEKGDSQTADSGFESSCYSNSNRDLGREIRREHTFVEKVNRSNSS